MLVERGFAVAFDSNCLLVRDIPYIDAAGQLQLGAIVAKLVFVDETRVEQDDHQIYFAGSLPYQLDGTPIGNLGGGETTIQLTERCSDIVVQRSFSNKPMPKGKFDDFADKIESYVSIISGPAIERFGISPHTFRSVEAADGDPIFKFQDTMTSRAQIGDLNANFASERVAVIGLGGTGAYLLDMLVRTPLPEVLAFDSDLYHVHTAFRSPGRLDPAEFGRSKAEVYAGRYDNFRQGLSVQTAHIDAGTAHLLDGVTFAFVCVDKGSSRSGIFDVLIDKGIPFIDVGMGLNRKHGPLDGMMRATLFGAQDAREMRDRNLAETVDTPDGLYRANIQVGELNALNACLAIVRYKQIRGFYRDTEGFKHLLFGISDLHLVGESYTDEV
ncbi:ThiF family adenylyltransferase [Glacieibacterium frigidum]|uniref:ThiF family adenylyltransferase n=1 Tax=Glacieibacterium frigidum TaxID=2593303 RepID=UPI001A9CAF6C|nr:ThiF family adenylyltransferase [Glacieibacterium frigidum]